MMKTMRLFGFVLTFGIRRALPTELTCVRCDTPVSDKGEYYCPVCMAREGLC